LRRVVGTDKLMDEWMREATKWWWFRMSISNTLLPGLDIEEKSDGDEAEDEDAERRIEGISVGVCAAKSDV
jgi:hypothetical protein